MAIGKPVMLGCKGAFKMEHDMNFWQLGEQTQHRLRFAPSNDPLSGSRAHATS